MPGRRNNRSHSATLLAILVSLILAPTIAPSGGRVGAETAANASTEIATPMSQATADDVAFSLISISRTDESTLEIEVRVENQGDLPVSIESSQVTLTIAIASEASDERELKSSTPELPCSITPGVSLSITFIFELEAEDEPQAISIGITELNRSGAMVIFPLAPGAGASAIGGSGHAGSSATGSPVPLAPRPNAEPSPGATPDAGSCRK